MYTFFRAVSINVVWATWIVPMYGMMHFSVRYDVLQCAAWHIPTSDMPLSFVRHDSFLCVAFLIPWTCHDAFSEMQKDHVTYVSITQVTFHRKRRTTRTTLFSLVKGNPHRILYTRTITAPSTCSHTRGIVSGLMPMCGERWGAGVEYHFQEI